MIQFGYCIAKIYLVCDIINVFRVGLDVFCSGLGWF